MGKALGTATKACAQVISTGSQSVVTRAVAAVGATLQACCSAQHITTHRSSMLLHLRQQRVVARSVHDGSRVPEADAAICQTASKYAILQQEKLSQRVWCLKRHKHNLNQALPAVVLHLRACCPTLVCGSALAPVRGPRVQGWRHWMRSRP